MKVKIKKKMEELFALPPKPGKRKEIEETFPHGGQPYGGSRIQNAEKEREGFEERACFQGLFNVISKEDCDRMIDEEIDTVLDERCQKGYKTHATQKTKKMFGKTYRNCVKAEAQEEFPDKVHAKAKYIQDEEGKPRDQAYAIAISMYEKGDLKEADPKKGTGKKPKGSGRRLYTDEDPSDTVGVKFRTVSDIRDTLSKKSFKSKSHKRQSQIINLIHQRARAAYQNAKDPVVKARLKKAYNYAKKRKEASKKKTKRMQKNK